MTVGMYLLYNVTMKKPVASNSQLVCLLTDSMCRLSLSFVQGIYYNDEQVYVFLTYHVPCFCATMCQQSKECFQPYYRSCLSLVCMNVYVVDLMWC